MDPGVLWNIKDESINSNLWILNQSLRNVEASKEVLADVEGDDWAKRVETNRYRNWLYARCFSLQQPGGWCRTDFCWAVISPECDSVTQLHCQNLFVLVYILIHFVELIVDQWQQLQFKKYAAVFTQGIPSSSKACLAATGRRESGLRFADVLALCIVCLWKVFNLIKGAMDLWRNMRKQGLKMSTVGYNSILDSQARMCLSG